MNNPIFKKIIILIQHVFINKLKALKLNMITFQEKLMLYKTDYSDAYIIFQYNSKILPLE